MVALILCLTAATVTYAIPRFSAKAEQKCNLCHISPNGGGMRSNFGSQFFAQTEMAAHKVDFGQIDNFQPALNKNISIGADLRTLYYFNDNDSSRQSTFFQMEGSLYLDAQFNDRVSLLISKGLNADLEAYGLAYVIPLNGYIKMGKFLPSYGWNYDDHTSYVREKMLWSPQYFDTGIEFGIAPPHFSASVGFFNGNISSLDSDKGKAIVSRFECRHHLGFLGFAYGGSFYFNDRPTSDTYMYGPLFYAKIHKFLYTSEFDWLKNKRAGRDSMAMATTQEFAYEIKQGYWFKAQYDFLDPDTKNKTGSLSRYSFGFQYFPIGFVEILPQVRYNDRVDYRSKHNRYASFDGQVHFFF